MSDEELKQPLSKRRNLGALNNPQSLQDFPSGEEDGLDNEGVQQV